MAFIIQIRRDTAANWTAANPILAQGEMAIELDTNKEKIGDGITAWNSLAYKTLASADSLYLGFYDTELALTTAHPTALAGNYAVVGATDTVWVWDTDTTAWVDSGNELGSVPPNSVGVAELKEAFKTVIDLGNVSGTVNLDFSLAVKYKLNMTATTTLTFSNVTDYVGIKTQQLELTSNSDAYVLNYPTGVNAARDLTDANLTLTNYFTFFPHTATVFQSSVIAQ